MPKPHETSEREDEADGLIWFLRTPYIPAADAIRHGIRTLKISSGKGKTRVTTWERLEELVQTNVAGTYKLVELLIEQELAADYAFLPYENVAPILKAALCCDDSDTQVRAKRLVNKLGERGFFEFGKLLSPDQN